MIHGIDISSYQGKLDFHSVKDNADFVIIRSTYGNGYKDTNFEINRDGARAVGLCVGFYHFAYPQYNTPEGEATWFTKCVSCQPGEILVLDFEEPVANPVDWCKRFLDKVTANMGFKPLIYLSPSFINASDWTPVINAGYGLWLAHYDNNPVQVDNTPWYTVAMKQYSDKGSINGVTVDLDVFYGDTDVFKKYGNPPPPPIPQPVSETAIGNETIATLTLSPSQLPSKPPTKFGSLLIRFLRWLRLI
jgi:GH25 family lysozyme M1 (1,4-beta-N-acetylmuramidase)